MKGHGRKLRQRVHSTPATTAFALLLGHLVGDRGTALFASLWTQALDASPDELVRLALDARRLGYLDMSHAGGVTDVSFTRLLAPEERR